MSAAEVDVGVVGLGDIGAAMALAMCDAGLSMAVYDRRPAAMVPLADAGAIAVESVAAVGGLAPIVSIIVLNDEQVVDVVRGLATTARPGAVFIVHSTVRPATVVQLADDLTAKGIQLVDAAVSGGREKARRGDLTVMIGGTDRAVAQCESVLAALGRQRFHVGPVGAGAAAKVVNNLLSLGTYALQLEAMEIAAANGIDEDTVTEVVAASQGDSRGIRTWGRMDRIRRERLAHSEPSTVYHEISKDLVTAAAVARSAALDAPVTAAVASLLPGKLARRDEVLDREEPRPTVPRCDRCGQELAAPFRLVGMHPECAAPSPPASRSLGSPALQSKSTEERRSARLPSSGSRGFGAGGTMLAARCHRIGDPDWVHVERVAVPEPTAGQVLVEVAAAAVNFSDTLLLRGSYQVTVEMPFTAGSEFAGVVQDVAEGVTAFVPGDRVMGATLVGAFAEIVAAPASGLSLVPDGVDLQVAAAFRVSDGTAYHALRTIAKVRPGEWVAVLGAAGGVGSACIEVGRLLGARVVALASTDAKLDHCRELAADATVNTTTENVKGRLREITGGGADVVVDPVGGPWSEEALRGMRRGGRFVSVGFASGEIPRIPLNLPLLKGVWITGLDKRTLPEFDPDAEERCRRDLVEWLARGRLRPRISRTALLEDTASALADVAERRAVGKIVIDVTAGARPRS